LITPPVSTGGIFFYRPVYTIIVFKQITSKIVDKKKNPAQEQDLIISSAAIKMA